MSNFWKEAVVLLKLWLLMLMTYLAGVLAFDLTFYGWVDLRPDAIARVLYLPVLQAVALQLLTLPRRRAQGKA